MLFKFPGLAVLTVLFSFTQVPAMLKDDKAMEAAAARLRDPGLATASRLSRVDAPAFDQYIRALLISALGAFRVRRSSVLGTTSDGQYARLQEGDPQDRPPHRSQQGAPLARPHLPAQVRRGPDRGDAGAAKAAFVEAQSELMRAVSKGVVHKNTGARKVSRLAARLKKLATA